MPAPPETPGRWLRCAPVCEGDGRLQSLATLEEQLEDSFGLLKQSLAKVRKEIDTTSLEPHISTRSVFVDPGVARELEGNFSNDGPSITLKTKLEVPSALLKARIHLKDFASRSVSMAGDRAGCMGQAVDLVMLNTGQQPLRLHGRWMEMVNRGNQMLAGMGIGRKKGKRLIGGAMAEVEKAKQDDDDLSEVVRPNDGKNLLLPHQKFRLIWDMAGLLLILVDAVLLPLSLAWDVGIEPTDNVVGTWINCFSFFLALIFWSTDVLIQFNTGYYHNGRLEMSRRRIAQHYTQTWLLFDILLISLDVATAVYQFGMSESGGASVLRSMRALRVLRAFRLLRLLKMSRLSAVIEEASIAAGRQWLVLVVAIVNTTLTILVCAHVLACFWFWIGRDRFEKREISWIELSQAESVSGPIQYMHALQWILTPPAPLVVAADSGLERAYCIFLQGCTVVVIGSSLSKITGTLTELRTINSEGSRRRREVRQYLHAQKVSMELTSRIMRFVDYKLDRQSSVALDPSLLSPSLRIELHVSQRGHMLKPHPLFDLLNEIHPEVFAAICGAVEKQVFGKMEMVFQAHSWAECMWITGTGRFLVVPSDVGFDMDDLTISRSATVAEATQSFTGCHWFTEAALFAEAVTHDCSLRALTFAEAFTLKGEDLARTLMNSPDCTALFCEYGKDLLAKIAIEKSKDTWSSAKAEELSRTCLQQNSYFQEVHPDPKTVLHNVHLFKDVVYLQAWATARASGMAEMKKILNDRFWTLQRKGKSLLFSRGDSNAKSAVANSSEDLQLEAEVQQEEEYVDNTSTVSPEQSYKRAKEQLQDLAEGLLNKKVKVSEVAGSLSDSIPELMEKRGTHDVFGQAVEREKSESCCISLMALVVGSYQDYTEPQPPQARLSENQWNQLQELVQWTQPTASMIRAALVLLAIRALGKSKRILQQLPPNYHRPETAVIFLMRTYPDVVPSVKSLDEEELELMSEALEVHKDLAPEDFNLAQMLQGENVPASVFQLQEVIKRLGMEIFRFYILFLLGFMSGLAGGQGSRFMTARNAGSVIAGVTTLLHILDSSPQAIYWSYIELRARQLNGIPCGSPEDMALARLACLARVQDQKGFKSLRQSWELLWLRERNTLVRHFLADGIDEHAFVCEFLPDCVAKARDNRHIGLPLLLEVLVNLIEHLQGVEIKLSSEHQGVKMISVNLSDMAEFIPIVQNRFIFSTCISRSKIKMEDSRWYLQMTSANWSRTHEPDSDTTTLAYGVKELLQRQKFMQDILAASRKDP